jgi:phenylpyruvate tautomerase
MPVLTLQTNVGAQSIPATFAADLVEVVASALGKPKSYVVVNIQADQNINWGGSAAPAALATLMSIGQINPEANKNTSALISNHLEKALHVPADRFYLTFQDVEPANIGYNGTTFAEIMK